MLTREEIIRAKECHPDMLLVFQMDVGELVYIIPDDDHQAKAQAVSVKTCFPLSALTKNLRALLTAGHRVALCEQTETPQ